MGLLNRRDGQSSGFHHVFSTILCIINLREPEQPATTPTISRPTATRIAPIRSMKPRAIMIAPIRSMKASATDSEKEELPGGEFARKQDRVETAAAGMESNHRYRQKQLETLDEQWTHDVGESIQRLGEVLPQTSSTVGVTESDKDALLGSSYRPKVDSRLGVDFTHENSSEPLLITQSSRYLTLPLEIRLKIFSHCLPTLDHVDIDDNQTIPYSIYTYPLPDSGQVATKDSLTGSDSTISKVGDLRLICRQITCEFDPMFFSNTTLVVRNSLNSFAYRLDAESVYQMFLSSEIAEGTHAYEQTRKHPRRGTRGYGEILPALEFNYKFSHAINTESLGRTRKLVYEFSGAFAFGDLVESRHTRKLDGFARSDLEVFATLIERHENDLQRLEQVVIKHKIDGSIIIPHGPSIKDLMWEQLNGAENLWLNVRDCFQCLRDWEVVFRMKYYDCMHRTNWVVSRFDTACRDVTECQMVFTRRGHTKMPLATGWIELSAEKLVVTADG